RHHHRCAGVARGAGAYGPRCVARPLGRAREDGRGAAAPRRGRQRRRAPRNGCAPARGQRRARGSRDAAADPRHQSRRRHHPRPLATAGDGAGHRPRHPRPCRPYRSRGVGHGRRRRQAPRRGARHALRCEGTAARQRRHPRPGARPPRRAEGRHRGGGGVLKDTTVAVSAFGTADQTLALKADLPLGTYPVRVQRKRDGRWRDAAATSYRVAEYRPPEFLVTVAADSGPRLTGDTVHGTIEARYLFGAPMARAAVSWYARSRRASGWEVEVPNTEGYYLGETGWWWEEGAGDYGPGQVVAQGEDTLDGQGRLALALAAPPPAKGKAAAVSFEATVTDVNRQAVTAGAAVIVHPAAFYIGAKVTGDEWFWTAEKPRDISVIAARPDGRRVAGVAVQGALIRREWHRVRREREGYAEDVGEWVSDTVGRCAVTTAATPVTCTVTPPGGGSYTVALTATDPAGRPARTTFYRWAAGPGWIPWNDESQFKM